MTECCICLEQLQLLGDKRPKLLPCTHTVCLQCLKQRSKGRSRIQCPECCAFHIVPKGNAKEFQTNRYILKVLEADLQHKMRSADEVKQSIIHETELAQNKVNKNSGTRMTLGVPSILLFGNCFLIFNPVA